MKDKFFYLYLFILNNYKLSLFIVSIYPSVSRLNWQLVQSTFAFKAAMWRALSTYWRRSFHHSRFCVNGMDPYHSSSLFQLLRKRNERGSLFDQGPLTFWWVFHSATTTATSFSSMSSISGCKKGSGNVESKQVFKEIEPIIRSH